MLKLLEINGTASFSSLGEALFVETVGASPGVSSSLHHLRLLYSSKNSTSRDL